MTEIEVDIPEVGFKMVLSTSPHLAVRAALQPNMAFQQIALLAHADYTRRGIIEGIYEAI